MIKKIENEFLTVEVNELGAELFSIKGKKTGTEYLWQGRPEYWKDRSPVLFPICGRLFEGKYVYNGKEYEMPIHGIAKLYEFTTTFVSQTDIELTLKSNNDTKRYYPFDFVFKVRYSLDGEKLNVELKVVNMGKGEMYFSFGAHPGFNVPFNDNDKFEDYFIEFTKDCMDKLVMSDRCLFLNETEKYPLEDKKLQLKHNLFDHDAIFLVTDTDKVVLKSSKHDNTVEISYEDMTCVGFWHKPKVEAPYVCIEPWHGVPADDGVTDDLATKRQMIRLEKNGTYSNTYTIKISEK